jgi:hypothetical protein
MSEEQFLFDDFFVSPENQGVEVSILVRGRHVPLKLRPLSVSDEIEAQSGAVTKRMDPDGKVTIDKIDEALGNALLMSKGIVSWPFTNADGSPVPITPQTCSKILGEAGTQITKLIGELSGSKAALAPFVSSSDAA